MEAGSGAEALVLAATASAAVLDVHLPDIHGLEGVPPPSRQPSYRFPPIVHISGIYVSEDDGERGQRAGADAYFIAPVSSWELAGTLDNLLAGCALDAQHPRMRR